MTQSWLNETGRPLSSFGWLDAHHRAKLPERTAFGRRLAGLDPMSVVDIGCGTGLWLEVLDGVLPEACEFIGVDSDPAALDAARSRSLGWSRNTTFFQIDFDEDVTAIPAADLTLAFNVFPYVTDLTAFLQALAARVPRGALAVRQYDGGAMRFGPMETSQRMAMEASLFGSVGGSDMFRHYDMDRVLEALHSSSFDSCDASFELFQRFAPFSDEFVEYYTETLKWTKELISEYESDRLDQWMSTEADSPRYFTGVDLVAVLS